MYTLYILRCSDKTLYTGVTHDVEKRIVEHNTSKRGSKYVRSRRPATLVYSQRFRSRSKVLREEYNIKQMTKGKKLALFQKRATIKALDH